METLRVPLSPRVRLVAACGLVLGLSALAPLGGMSAAAVARWLLGAVALAGLAWWWARGTRTTSRFALPERMRVVSRTGLSQRCGLALVEVDGRSYLVAYGDSFAEIRAMRGARRVPGRSHHGVLESAEEVVP